MALEHAYLYAAVGFALARTQIHIRMARDQPWRVVVLYHCVALVGVALWPLILALDIYREFRSSPARSKRRRRRRARSSGRQPRPGACAPCARCMNCESTYAPEAWRSLPVAVWLPSAYPPPLERCGAAPVPGAAGCARSAGHRGPHVGTGWAVADDGPIAVRLGNPDRALCEYLDWCAERGERFCVVCQGPVPPPPAATPEEVVDAGSVD